MANNCIRSVLSNGLGVLNKDPFPGAGDATIVQWDRSDGFPGYIWYAARLRRDDDPTRPKCRPEEIQVFNVSYPDCLDQDP